MGAARVAPFHQLLEERAVPLDVAAGTTASCGWRSGVVLLLVSVVLVLLSLLLRRKACEPMRAAQHPIYPRRVAYAHRHGELC